MTIAQIKAETLKLMFVNVNEDVLPEKMQQYENDEIYKGYLVNMTGALNRCFTRLEVMGALPSKSVRLDVSDASGNDGRYVRFNFSRLIDDFHSVDRIALECSDGYYLSSCPYMREGEHYVLEAPAATARYVLVYRPKLPRVSHTSDDSEVLAIPDDICSLIPYYLKGELYRDDEPNEAAEARNIFEAEMGELMAIRVSYLPKVENIYGECLL